MLRMEARDLGRQRQLTEDAARRESEAMERDARLAFYFIKTNSSKSQTRILVLHNAMNQAVWGSTERHEGMMIQEIRVVRKIDTKGTRRKSGRRVAQVVGSEAHVALGRQRNHLLHEDQVLLQAAQREK